jgi:hypothetical protein
MESHPVKRFVRVVNPSNSGNTRARIERGVTTGYEFCWEIPTNLIPPHLRRIGSLFYITVLSIGAEDNDSIDKLREASHYFLVEPYSGPNNPEIGPDDLPIVQQQCYVHAGFRARRAV